MEPHTPRRDFWTGAFFGCLLAILLNLLPYLRTRGGHHGLEVIGFPFVFHSFGGTWPQHVFYWWALLTDILLAAYFALVVGFTWSTIRERHGYAHR